MIDVSFAVKENLAPPEPETTGTTCLMSYPMTPVPHTPDPPPECVTNGVETMESASCYQYAADEEVAEEGGNMDDWVTEFDP